MTTPETPALSACVCGWGLCFGFFDLASGGWGLRVGDLGFGVGGWGLGFGVWGLGLGFGVRGVGFGVWGLGLCEKRNAGRAHVGLRACHRPSCCAPRSQRKRKSWSSFRICWPREIMKELVCTRIFETVRFMTFTAF